MSVRPIGYAHVSTLEQELHLQLDALKAARCKKQHILTDQASGLKYERLGLKEHKDGDTLIDWRLDRLGRSLRNLIDIVEALKGRGVGFRSLNDGGCDTTTASGEMIFNIFATLAQFERWLIQECTRARLPAARAKGRKFRFILIDINQD